MHVVINNEFTQSRMVQLFVYKKHFNINFMTNTRFIAVSYCLSVENILFNLNRFKGVFIVKHSCLQAT